MSNSAGDKPMLASRQHLQWYSQHIHANGQQQGQAIQWLTIGMLVVSLCNANTSEWSLSKLPVPAYDESDQQNGYCLLRQGYSFNFSTHTPPQLAGTISTVAVEDSTAEKVC